MNPTHQKVLGKRCMEGQVVLGNRLILSIAELIIPKPVYLLRPSGPPSKVPGVSRPCSWQHETAAELSSDLWKSEGKGPLKGCC